MRPIIEYPARPTPADVPPASVEVAARRRRGVWLLTFVGPCERCNSHHQHGGGRDSEPSFGCVGTHCTDSHRVFRDDCQVAPKVYGRRCRLQHGDVMVELVPASPLIQQAVHTLMDAGYIRVGQPPRLSRVRFRAADSEPRAAHTAETRS